MKIDSETLKEIKEIIGSENVRENEIMAGHLSMRVGGPADYFMTPKSEQQICSLVKKLNEKGIRYYVIGNGTNIIMKDSGFDGVIIRILDDFDEVSIKGNVVTAQAGIKLKKLADAAMEAGLTGLEFSSGIPGSLGGALTMNAGAYDGEMKNVVSKVRAVTREGKVITLSNEEADFSYRHSAFSEGNLIVIGAEMILEPGEREAIKAKMDDLNQRRRDKQPLEFPSCGSTFKRPEGNFAGKLIMDSNLAGRRVGGASVSTKHCGFIINDEKGSAKDVLELIELVKKEVREKQGVELECEVRFL